MALIPASATVVTSQREGVRAVDTIELTVLATAAANHQLTVCGEWLWLKDRQAAASNVNHAQKEYRPPSLV